MTSHIKTPLSLLVFCIATGCVAARDPESDDDGTEASSSVTESGGQASDTPSDSSESPDTTGTTAADTAAPSSAGSTSSPDDTTSSAGSASTTGPVESCVAFDLGSAVGSNIHEATVDSSGNDYALMNCVEAIDSGGFVSDPPPATEDYVIAWTFPESGEFTVETSGTAAVLGVAPPDCEAEITTCNDECFGDAAGFVIEGRAGETVHLIVETFDAGEAFHLSIQPGTVFTCETESGGTGTSDGTGGDPCEGVTCKEGEICVGGICVDGGG